MTRGVKTRRPRWYGVVRGLLITLQMFIAMMVFLRGWKKNHPKIRGKGVYGYPASSVGSTVAGIQGNDGMIRDESGSGTPNFIFVFIALVAASSVVTMLSAALDIYDYRGSTSQDPKKSTSLHSVEHSGRDFSDIYSGFMILGAGGIYILVTKDIWQVESWMDANGWLGQDNRNNKCTLISLLPSILLVGVPIVLLEAIPKMWKDRSVGLSQGSKDFGEGEVPIEKQKNVA